MNMTARQAAEIGEEEDTQRGKYLTFALGQEVYAIEIRYVTEIIGMLPISEIPEMPAYLRGIVNLRGKIIPVMDVRLRFGKPAIPYNDRTCVIVIEVGSIAIGLIVDRVSEVMEISDSDIVPPPDVNQSGSPFIRGIGNVGGDVKLILHGEALIREPEIGRLQES
jgi:purine-binding chemotaxis protein CheW